MKLLKFLKHSVLNTFDKVTKNILKVFIKDDFGNMVFRLKLYKRISKKLYNSLWKELTKYLRFRYNQFDIVIEKDGSKKTYKSTGLSHLNEHDDHKISFEVLKNTKHQRHLLIAIKKGEVEKFKDDIFYRVYGQMTSAGKDNHVRSSVISGILSLIHTINENYSNQIYQSKIETEA